MKIQVIIVLAVVAAVAAYQNSASSQTTQYYCGRHLSRTLANLCAKDYIMKGQKRGDFDDSYGAGFTKSWLSERQALALFQGRSKRQQQMVVTECCDKACSKEELMTYCSP